MFVFSISVSLPLWCILYFSRTAIMYVKIWSRILSVVGQWVCLRVTNNASDMHSVGLSLRCFAKIIILGENLHFSFNNLLYNLFNDWNKDPCFFVSLYSWMFPNSFILVMLDFVWYCYHQLSAISLSFLIWSLYVTFGEVCFLLMLIEWSREVGVSVWNFYQLYFSL